MQPALEFVYEHNPDKRLGKITSRSLQRANDVRDFVAAVNAKVIADIARLCG